QALCILCGYLCNDNCIGGSGSTPKVIREVNKFFWAENRRLNLPPVRQQMEIFTVRMCLAYPSVFMPSLIKELEDTQQRAQTTCSLLIISGHVLTKGKGILATSLRQGLFKACLPWLVGVHAIGRIVAQLIAHEVLPEAISEAKRQRALLGGGVEESQSLGDTIATTLEDKADCFQWSDVSYLEGIYTFLNENADMVKMRNKQVQAFHRTDCVALCEVDGMLSAYGIDPTGEVTPVHLTHLIQEAMDEIFEEAEQEMGMKAERGRALDKIMAKLNDGTWFESDQVESSPLAPDMQHIQQKILPWDTLDLAVDMAKETSLKLSTAAGRARQHVVMCATLVEKVKG
ncbi:unnamed protein product, partial [Choristocarpus tenellus]